MKGVEISVVINIIKNFSCGVLLLLLYVLHIEQTFIYEVKYYCAKPK